MIHGLQGLALAALAVASGVAVWVQDAHYDQRDDGEAVLRVRTHRFGPASRMRLSTWLKASGLREGATWRTERAGLGVTQVHLALRDGRHGVFAVDRVGQVTALDEGARALVQALLAHAATPAPAAPTVAPESPPPSAPPVRPYVPDQD